MLAWEVSTAAADGPDSELRRCYGAICEWCCRSWGSHAEAANLSAIVVRGDAVKSGRERAEEKRKAKLDLVREQVDDGSLVIRPMTAEERRRYPPRPPRPDKRGKR
jgi:hypothetical protein